VDSSALLRSAGLRITAQRQLVLRALEGSPHASAAELSNQISEQDEPATQDVSRQGLYNVLDDLSRVGLIRCIEPAGSAARYELRTSDNHHHLVCRSCGRIEDVGCAVGAAPCLEPSDRGGFLIEQAEVTWWGQCAACAAAAGQNFTTNRAEPRSPS
jgi:Fur family transcriptional regulator, stress-responsive regulator